MDKRKFLANLNVFVPLFVYGCSFLVGVITAMMMPTSPPADPSVYVPVDTSAEPYIVLAWVGVLALVWMTVGRSPKGLAPGREGRHWLGHILLGVINVSVFGTALLPLLLANLTGIEAIGHLMWFGIPVLVIAHCAWPVGLLMVWTSRGPIPAWPAPEPRAKSSASSSKISSVTGKPVPSSPMKSPQDANAAWRVGHTGRDCMYYEEQIDGRWERLEISGEMLMGTAHHVIYFASAKDWNRYPEWARDRRPEIIRRIKSAFREPDYEYQGA